MTEDIVAAVRNGDAASVQRLLNAGADPAACDSEERTLLMVAARAGHNEVLSLLLDHGMAVNLRSRKGFTALMSACGAGKLETVQLLIRRGAEVNAATSQGATALFRAVIAKRTGVVEVLLNAGAEPKSVGSDGKFSPLKHAVRAGLVDIVRLLLDRGADVNGVSDTQVTMLAHAVMARQMEVARLLLERGANPNTQSLQMSPLIFAMAAKNEDMVRLLLEHGAQTQNVVHGVSALSLTGACPEVADILKQAKGTDLHDAAAKGHLDLLLSLLDKRPGVDRQDDRQRTALMMVADEGHLDCVQALLDRGADPNAADNYQHNSLIRAAAKGHTAVVKLLLERGAEVDAVNQWGQTALFRAATADHRETARLLIEAGARVYPVEAALLENRELLERLFREEIDTPNKAGATALMGASTVGAVDLLVELLNRGADIRARDLLGKDALAWAVQHGHPRAAETLLERGSPVNENGLGDFRLLNSAIFTESLEMLPLLLRHGFNPDSVGELGQYALKIALDNGKEEAVRILLDGGADPNGPPGVNETPLIAAVKALDENYLRVLREKGLNPADTGTGLIRLLLDQGADPNRAGGAGKTPLEAAAEQGSEEAVTALLDAGANIATEGVSGPLILTAMKGNNRMLQLLMERAGPALLKENGRGVLVGLGPLLIAAVLGRSEIVDLFKAASPTPWPEWLDKLVKLGKGRSS